jgi:hypothetical protein
MIFEGLASWVRHATSGPMLLTRFEMFSKFCAAISVHLPFARQIFFVSKLGPGDFELGVAMLNVMMNPPERSTFGYPPAGERLALVARRGWSHDARLSPEEAVLMGTREIPSSLSSGDWSWLLGLKRDDAEFMLDGICAWTSVSPNLDELFHRGNLLVRLASQIPEFSDPKYSNLNRNLSGLYLSGARLERADSVKREHRFREEVYWRVPTWGRKPRKEVEIDGKKCDNWVRWNGTRGLPWSWERTKTSCRILTSAWTMPMKALEEAPLVPASFAPPVGLPETAAYFQITRLQAW